MSLTHTFCHAPDMKLIAYEEMVDEKSYIFVRCGDEEMRIPISAWRKLNATWNEKAWDQKFDTLESSVG